MIVDKKYCMNSFLQFRFIADDNKIFKEGLRRYIIEPNQKYKIFNSKDLDECISKYVNENFDNQTALMLSSGIDSALLASYLPKNSQTFTLKCIARKETIDETIKAKEIAKKFGLKNSIIEVAWDDYEKYAPKLMEHKGSPIHSIEVQIYKAAIVAKELGYTKLLFGEAADIIFGGLDGLLAKDWKFTEFVDRYNFVPTKTVLNNYSLITKPFEKHRILDKIDMYGFMSTFFLKEALNSYYNACSTAEMKFLSPFKEMYLGVNLDLDIIRKGRSKYIIRDLADNRLNGIDFGKKIPMPRPTDLWLENWAGPKRNEFKNDCIKDLTGDQKFYIFILEQFLNLNNINQD